MRFSLRISTELSSSCMASMFGWFNNLLSYRATCVEATSWTVWIFRLRSKVNSGYSRNIFSSYIYSFKMSSPKIWPIDSSFLIKRVLDVFLLAEPILIGMIGRMIAGMIVMISLHRIRTKYTMTIFTTYVGQRLRFKLCPVWARF